MDGMDEILMQEQVIELQAKLTLAEDQIDSLNKTVFEQRQLLDELARQVVALRRQVQDIAPAEPTSLRDELPPHY